MKVAIRPTSSPACSARIFKDLEVGLISLSPIYMSNLPNTQAEVDALEKMMADPKHEVLTFADGD